MTNSQLTLIALLCCVYGFFAPKISTSEVLNPLDMMNPGRWFDGRDNHDLYGGPYGGPPPGYPPAQYPIPPAGVGYWGPGYPVIPPVPTIMTGPAHIMPLAPAAPIAPTIPVVPVVTTSPVIPITPATPIAPLTTVAIPPTGLPSYQTPGVSPPIASRSAPSFTPQHYNNYAEPEVNNTKVPASTSSVEPSRDDMARRIKELEKRLEAVESKNHKLVTPPSTATAHEQKSQSPLTNYQYYFDNQPIESPDQYPFRPLDAGN